MSINAKLYRSTAGYNSYAYYKTNAKVIVLLFLVSYNTNTPLASSSHGKRWQKDNSRISYLLSCHSTPGQSKSRYRNFF